MNYKIRAYRSSEYEMIKSWWISHNEPPPAVDMMPLDTSFIMEVDGHPSYCVSIILTNVLGMCYLENFIKDPGFTKKDQDYGKILSVHVDDFIKKMGYKRVVCYSYRPQTAARYNELGYKMTQYAQFNSHVKEL